MRKQHLLRNVLLVALLARMALFAISHPWTLSVDEQLGRNNDSALYHRLGISLEKDGDFNDDENIRPHALRTPGYPLFIAGIYSIFGHAPWVVIFFQILLDVAACALLFLALWSVIGEKAAAAAAMLYALDPIVLLYDSFVLSEALCSALLIAALFFGLRATSAANFSSKVVNVAVSGLAFGFAALVRPSVQYLPVFLLIFLLMANHKQWKSAVALSLTVLLAFTAAISPWLYRNYSQFDAIALSTSGSYNLLSQNVAANEAGRRGVDFRTESRRLMSEADAIMIAHGGNPDSNPFLRSKYEMEVAKRYIKNDWDGFLWRHLKGTAYMFVNLGSSDYQKLLGLDHGRKKSDSKPFVILLIAAVIAVFFALSYAAVVKGFRLAWKNMDRTALYFLLFMAAYFIMTPGAFALARFKIPAMIFLYPFAGLGLVWMNDKFYERRLRGQAATASLRTQE